MVFTLQILYMKRFLIIVGCILSFTSFAQRDIDVLHYSFDLELTDVSDAITGKAVVTVKFLEPASELVLDLASVEEDRGMQAFMVTDGGKPVLFFHSNDELHIRTPSEKGQVRTFEISYMGVPKDGLIISKNKFGDRTFFADNWPNRAHQWIPTHDVPNDKASFEFTVTAPEKYEVISNGLKQSETLVKNGTKRTHWKEDIPLSTKIMVIGVADFAVKTYADSPDNIPVTAWVYPQDSSKAFYDYAVAPEIVKFFSTYIAPYPYRKLANVQSKTIFGGMENASAIFYAEEAITGKRSSEATVVHEIVHQWFGDMATEKSFAHLWLSEGFATYLTHIYFEQKYGKTAMQERLKKDREAVIAFASKNKMAVVDSTSELMSLLNANSYQKGAWVLHMLRAEVGGETFQKIVQEYYQQFKGMNADTRDFQSIAEKVSAKKLDWFFDQWLYRGGVPKLSWKWKPDGNKMKLEIIQSSETMYTFPLEIQITTVDGKTITHKLFINCRETELKTELPSKVMKVRLDPDMQLLFEEVRN